MQNYKVVIAYDGRKYTGFNKSKGNADKTVQGKLEQILLKLYGQAVEVTGAVSTDAGVHAKGQVVNFTAIDDRLSKYEIFEYIEKYLTDDIILLSIEETDERFHSRYLVESVTYEYRLWKSNAKNRPLFERQYVNLMSQRLETSKMKKAATLLVGEHDFLAFTTNKKTKNSTKTMTTVDVEETKDEIIITMTATGFLLNMERLIVGTLIQIGLGQLPAKAINKAFASKSNEDVGHKVSAGALCLVSVEY